MTVDKKELNKQIKELNLQDVVEIARSLPVEKREAFLQLVNEQFGDDFLKKLKKGEI